MSNNYIISENDITSKIYLIRNKRVMLDRDLALLYNIQTKRLKEQVKRNIKRFPEDFMFELTKKELNIWRSQFATSNNYIKKGLRRSPYAFTEQGVAMLSSVLNSNKAITVNIQIMRAFVRIKELILTNTELRLLIETIERRINDHDITIENNKQEIQILARFIKQLLKPSLKKQKTKIGFLVE